MNLGYKRRYTSVSSLDSNQLTDTDEWDEYVVSI